MGTLNRLNRLDELAADRWPGAFRQQDLHGRITLMLFFQIWTVTFLLIGLGTNSATLTGLAAPGVGCTIGSLIRLRGWEPPSE
jgi:hypothetical protein